MKKDNNIIETYVVPMKMCTFTVRIPDPETGEPMPLRDPGTGQWLRANGQPLYVEETLKFLNVIDNVKKGCLCKYVVTKDTPKHIADTLAELLAKPNNPIITMDEWVKTNNPERFAEMELRRKAEAEKELAVKEAYEKGLKEAKNLDLEIEKENLANEVAEKDEAITKLQEKVAKLTKGSKS